jgi:hypothetical protein
MKKAKFIIATLLSVFILYGVDAQHRSFNCADDSGPDIRIEKKIKKGIRSGDLTRKEVRHLENELAYIDKLKRKAWRNGRLNNREESKIRKHMYKFDRLLDEYLYNRHHRLNSRNSEKYDHRNGTSRDDEYDFYYRNKKHYNKRH